MQFLIEMYPLSSGQYPFVPHIVGLTFAWSFHKSLKFWRHYQQPLLYISKTVLSLFCVSWLSFWNFQFPMWPPSASLPSSHLPSRLMKTISDSLPTPSSLTHNDTARVSFTSSLASLSDRLSYMHHFLNALSCLGLRNTLQVSSFICSLILSVGGHKVQWQLM